MVHRRHVYCFWWWDLGPSSHPCAYISQWFHGIKMENLMFEDGPRTLATAVMSLRRSHGNQYRAAEDISIRVK